MKELVTMTENFSFSPSPSPLSYRSYEKHIPHEVAPVPPPKHWTITELTHQIKSVLEPSFSQIWIQGEISNYRPAASGHIYFSLKDPGACISAALFNWNARRKKLEFDLKEGLQVLCRGKISVYSPRGNYQFIIDHLEPLGTGSLQIAFEQLKIRLASEGLFDIAHKKPLPQYPLRVAVITSPTGAVIQDILNILKRRAPMIQVTLIPVSVQGESAPDQMIRGLELVHQFHLGEIIILARGGGSIEDLCCFNHEALARAIYHSQLPIISAIGHEIDFTIADFVSDLRAPTPSAAAEILSNDWAESIQWVKDYTIRLQNCILRHLATRKTLLAHITARIMNPKDQLHAQAQKIDELSFRLEKSIAIQLERKRRDLIQFKTHLNALSPLRVLERGYTLIHEPQESLTYGTLVKSAQNVLPGTILQIRFHDGTKLIQVIE